MPMNGRLRILAVAALAAGLVATPATPAAAEDATHRFPTTIALPDGFQPEGIAIGPGPFAYFGSRTNGAIYRASLATGEGRILSPATPGNTPSLGLKIDRRGRLFVAGGRAGDARVIDARTGAVLARYQFATPPGTFVNDVILTPRAAYFTDSNRAVLYRLPLGRRGQLPPADGFEILPLTGAIVVDPAMTNANGIARTPDGRALLIVQSNTGLLFRVNPLSGVTTAVDVGATLINGDGLLVIGRTLYVVQNRLNTVTVIRLDRAGTSGTVVKRITDPRFDIPTTVAAFRHRLYLPNARFGIPSPETAPYNAVAVHR
jgi:sugar lactone lactonase YvrE